MGFTIIFLVENRLFYYCQSVGQHSNANKIVNEQIIWDNILFSFYKFQIPSIWRSANDD
jgi:hypothetical protein